MAVTDETESKTRLGASIALLWNCSTRTQPRD
jgi:hypothetical protein